MPRHQSSLFIHAAAADVFALVHDYDQRLAWDSLLSEAQILGDAKTIHIGTRTLCVGKLSTLKIPMVTEYINFEPGRVAAVKLCNHPPFFKAFAATTRHEEVTKDESRITYIYSFESRPSILRWILNPFINWRLKRETQARLRSLKAFCETTATQRASSRIG